MEAEDADVKQDDALEVTMGWEPGEEAHVVVAELHTSSGAEAMQHEDTARGCAAHVGVL